jgi:hypothetical protein
MATLVSGINNLALAIRNKINLMVPRLLPGGGAVGQVLSKQSLNDYDSGWVTLGTAAQRNIGTSGNTVPLLSYANTWSEAQQLTKGLLLGSPDLNLEVFADTVNGLLAIQGKNDTLGAMMPLKIAGSAVNITGNTTIYGTLVASNLLGMNTGDQTITLTGDLSGTGTGSFAATLATVNANVGSFGSVTAVPIVTVNAKGLVTAVSTAALGNAAQRNIGTSGATVPLLNTANTWSAVQSFGAKITAASSATAGASFNIQQGTAPTTPLNGDIWTTSDGVYSYLNGANYSFVFTQKAAVFTAKVTTPATKASNAGFNIPTGVAPTTPLSGDLWGTSAGFFWSDSTATTRQFAFTDSVMTGNAATATKLTTPRAISITGDIAWTTTFDGSTDVTAAATLATVNSNVGTFGTNAAVPVITVNAKGQVTSVSTTALGTAAQKNTGTSGNNVALLDGANSWSTSQTIGGNLTVNGGATINNGLTVNRPANIDNIIQIGNPGVGFGSGFNFPKASDNAGLVVTETATDRTIYEFWMSDNPDGGDYFQWRWSDYQGQNGLFVPFRIGDLQNTFTSSTNNFYGSITQQSSTSGFFTTGDVSGSIAALKNTPYWNTVSKLPVVVLQGTVAITALNVSGYIGNNGYAMWIAATSDTTFSWGYGPFAPTPTVQEANLSFVAGQVTLANGVKVTFNAASGAVVGDTWQCRVYKPATNNLGRTTFVDQVTLTTSLAPLVVSSSVLVTNLNADILDNQHGAYYLNASNFNAGTLLAARLPARLGDVTSAAGSDTYTLATVNATVGTFGSAAAVPVITVNAKGLVTAVTTTALGTAAQKNTGTSGNTVALLDGVNTWSGAQTYSAKAIFPTATTSFASITLPHGQAPTSPVNGDVWTTGTALYLRMSAVTKMVAFTDSSITGSAATLTTGRTIAMTGDLTWTSPAFNGSANVSSTGVLATVNANVGTFGSATAVPILTVNAKGLVTAVSSATLGTSALKDTGTSGNVVALLDGANTWSATQAFGDASFANVTTTSVNATTFTRGTYKVFDEGNLTFGTGLLVTNGVVALAADSEPAFLSRFIATSGQTFTMANTVSTPNSIIVTQNGQRLDPTTDYSVSGVTLTILSTVMPDDVIIAERSGGSQGPQGPAGSSAGANSLDVFFIGTPAASQVVGGGIAASSMILNSMNSFARCVTGPTASVTFIIRANSTNIGTVVFTAGATVGLVNYSTTAVSMADLITIVAPANLYAIANVAFKLND